MRILIGLFLALIMAVATPATAQDQDASKRLALAHRFIELMQTDQMIQAISVMTTAVSPRDIPGMTPTEQAEYEAVVADMTAQVMPRMFDAIAPVYADIFTLEELEALVAFYESDIGQSMITKSYAAAPQMAEAMQAVMPQILADLGELICDRYECTPAQRREMKAAMAAPFDQSR